MAKKPKKRRIVGGVDTHSRTHHAAVTLMNGRRLADAEFAATGDGYEQLLAWMSGFGQVVAVGVEGTSSYGAGLSRYLRGEDISVVEVNHPDRRQRRVKGKSDPLDAYAAADAVISGRACAVPKAGDGIVESIRAVHTTRAGAVKARTACANELTALIVTAPTALRERLTARTHRRRAELCKALEPGPDLADPASGTMHALRSLAMRWYTLTVEIKELDVQLKTLVGQAAPQLLARKGVGPETAAQLLSTCGDNPDRLRSEAAFAALCGVSPVPASSGLTDRHRLNMGGDRQANRALHIIVLSRMSWSERTRGYVKARTAEGKGIKEIMRCLKRYVARELFPLLVERDPTPPPRAAPDLCRMSFG